MTTEERRKDREEFRGLWRDTQRQLSELTIQVVEMDDRLGERIEALAEGSRAADERLGACIEPLVSAMGEFASQTRR
jgi:hypothetical protein